MPEWTSFAPSTLFGKRAQTPYHDDPEGIEMNTEPTSQQMPHGAGTEQRTRSQDREQKEMPAVMRGLGIARHTLGLLLLLVVVVLWTTCNFLASSIFADDTYAQPFFLTYLNTSAFMLAMVPLITRSFWDLYRRGLWHDRMSEIKGNYQRGGWRAVTLDPGISGHGSEDSHDLVKDLDGGDDGASDEGDGLLVSRTSSEHGRQHQAVISDLTEQKRTHLALLPTAKLALGFCFLWFGANYFALACLEFTTVASTTILTSTSSIWTLMIGALTRTERFTWRKLLGVLASLFGIALISTLDSGATAPASSDGTTTPTAPTLVHLLTRAVKEFPSKPPSELLLGDALALLSAIIYGLYTVMLARTAKSAFPLELNMPLFFGLVGTWNFILLLPLFPILHYTNIEPFVMPPTNRVWMILVLNSIAALASDICWAYAMVLTSPLVVTVGLSLTIPLSLVGEMIIQGRYENFWYWIGAAVVVGSFVFVDREERIDEADGVVEGREAGGGAMRRSLSVGSASADLRDVGDGGGSGGAVLDQR